MGGRHPIGRSDSIRADRRRHQSARQLIEVDIQSGTWPSSFGASRCTPRTASHQNQPPSSSIGICSTKTATGDLIKTSFNMDGHNLAPAPGTQVTESGKATHAKDGPLPDHGQYDGDSGEIYEDSNDSNFVYIPIRSEMGIHTCRKCYPDDDKLNNMPRYLRVDRRYIGDDLSDPPAAAVAFAHGQHKAQKGKANKIITGLFRQESLTDWYSKLQATICRLLHGDHQEPNLGGRSCRPEAKEGRDRRQEPYEDRHHHREPYYGGEHYPQPYEGRDRDREPYEADRGRVGQSGSFGRSGTDVYGNIVMGDPTKVRIGEGNRGGRSTGGRVSGNVVRR